MAPQNVPPSNDQLTWPQRFAAAWQQTRAQAVQGLTQLTHWFNVSDERMVEILASVRAQLPTTEALLLGKPQAGKSSIVRGIAGVSAEIVGQGFQPHTQHTQRYAYPASEVPLIVFTDTVGLGDLQQDTEAIVAELLGDLEPESQRARIFILTVKINDFATDSLRQILARLRQAHPTIPCLLAVTCLHEVYPPELTDHPEYPPDRPEVTRPLEAVQANFAGLYDRAVAIDFTLEEDGFTPVFYGLDAFQEAIADLLPEAEARAIRELIAGGAAEQLGSLYREAGRRYILPFALSAAALAAVPLPLATMPVLTTLQVSMVGLLGQLYGKTLAPSQAGGVVSAIAGGFFAQAVGRELVKLIPGFGSAIAASWAAAYTWALGEAACVYFGDLLGGKTPDPDRIQQVMRESFQAAKERFRSLRDGSPGEESEA